MFWLSLCGNILKDFRFYFRFFHKNFYFKGELSSFHEIRQLFRPRTQKVEIDLFVFTSFVCDLWGVKCWHVLKFFPYSFSLFEKQFLFFQTFETRISFGRISRLKLQGRHDGDGDTLKTENATQVFSFSVFRFFFVRNRNQSREGTGKVSGYCFAPSYLWKHLHARTRASVNKASFNPVSRVRRKILRKMDLNIFAFIWKVLH